MSAQRTRVEYPDPRGHEAYIAVLMDDDGHVDGEPVLVVRVISGQRTGPYLDFVARERTPSWERPDAGGNVTDGAALWSDAAPLIARVMSEAAEVMEREAASTLSRAA